MAEKEKITLDSLALMSQKEFLAIGQRFDGVDKRFNKVDGDIEALRGELKAEIRDVRSAIDSSADRVVDEIKTFMQPHIKSLDTVLVDVEKLKEKVKI